jgi:hypothetical protein
MGKTSIRPDAHSTVDREQMHALYREGGRERQMAPQIVDPLAECPHDGCDRPMQAIDFRLEDHGRSIHDDLVRACWNDTGFAGRCPHCGGWIHFTIRGKTALTAEEAALLPQLPENWHEGATIL